MNDAHDTAVDQRGWDTDEQLAARIGVNRVAADLRTAQEQAGVH